MSESQSKPVPGLYEIVYAQGPDGRPIESARERVNDDQWKMAGKVLLLMFKPGVPDDGPCDITSLMSGEFPKFSLVK